MTFDDFSNLIKRLDEPLLGQLENMNPYSISEAEFKEFELRFRFKPRLKYGWFHFNVS